MEHKLSSKYNALFFNAIHTSVLPVLKRETMEIAYNIRKDVIRRIRRQTSIKPELTTAYIKRKIRYGLDWRKLIATEQYIKSIIVEETEYGARVGVKNIDHEGGPLSNRPNVPMHKIAEWLEYGTVRRKIGRGGPAEGQPWFMPPRPHWRPAQAKFERELSLTRKRLTQSMENALLEALLNEFDPEEEPSPVPVERFQHRDESKFKGFSKVAGVNTTSQYMNKYKTYISEGSDSDGTDT